MPPGARHLGATTGLPRDEFNGLGWAREWHTEGKGRKGPSEGACHEQKPVSQKNLKKKKRIKQVAGD